MKIIDIDNQYKIIVLYKKPEIVKLSNHNFTEIEQTYLKTTPKGTTNEIEYNNYMYDVLDDLGLMTQLETIEEINEAIQAYIESGNTNIRTNQLIYAYLQGKIRKHDEAPELIKIVLQTLKNNK